MNLKQRNIDKTLLTQIIFHFPVGINITLHSSLQVFHAEGLISKGAIYQDEPPVEGYPEVPFPESAIEKYLPSVGQLIIGLCIFAALVAVALGVGLGLSLS